GTASNEGSTWSATVEITIHDGDHNPVDDVYVAGEWSPGSFLVSDECTTGELGGIGSCIMLYPSIRKRVKSVSFTVTTVSKSGEVYDANANHDPDGDSDGTTITVNKP
ncbi:MAG: hypothetical protein GWM92_16960, partial [Gemmatimonadetes bacterium]|nr:hypothetical protein [Gemmatimonadota bacterium]NIR80460.1 hypothetical protein [Gemmatimonadota bacterium]NIT89221.1 hypothetical protein [Gemmatimonadota bacterium]NIU33020.1 hypothetical protein [Gemmatimonadota bacterium]NIU37404.1 hypothetical protein [Gemmatimonadota bacterium]